MSKYSHALNQTCIQGAWLGVSELMYLFTKVEMKFSKAVYKRTTKKPPNRWLICKTLSRKANLGGLSENRTLNQYESRNIINKFKGLILKNSTDFNWCK